jgi:hypothetical protein
MNMREKYFWPIFLKIENEFKELCYYIEVVPDQLEVYSINIAELILRTVAEVENVAKQICMAENIEFVDKHGNERTFVRFQEYIDKLNEVFDLQNKAVSVIYDQINPFTYETKLLPFKTTNGKNTWYSAYNSIKHNRVQNFEKANLGNFIDALSALFLLNLIYRNEIYYDTEEYNISKAVEKIESFSDVFCVDFTIENCRSAKLKDDNSLFNADSYWKAAAKFATYVIKYDHWIETDSDKGGKTARILNDIANGSFKESSIEKYGSKSLCKLIAVINKNKNDFA